MGKQGAIGDRFSRLAREAREARSWTQSTLAKKMTEGGCPMHWTTIAKIEKGERSVRIDEASVLADLLGTSVDAMLGRPTDDADLLWAISKLSSSAHKMINEIASLQRRLRADAQDVHDYAERGQKLNDIAPTLVAVKYLDDALGLAAKRAIGLAGEFPLPGRG
jgi:transcriptional regulator with XRE-family HTH domain